MSLLHVDSIRKNFGNKTVLSDVFLSCRKGEIIGLLGRNGSGKSTLLQIIFGSLQAECKFVRVENKIINKISDGRNLINYLPQDGFLPNHAKVNEIIKCFCNKKNKALLYENCLIKNILTKKPYQLSGGERRLVEIYLIIFSEAKIILLDEPFNGVAPVYREEIKKIIEDQKETKGFIITDHDYVNVLELATKTILLKDGFTKEIKDPKELIYLGYLPPINYDEKI